MAELWALVGSVLAEARCLASEHGTQDQTRDGVRDRFRGCRGGCGYYEQDPYYDDHYYDDYYDSSQ